MPRKHYCYTRSILYGIGEGWGVGGDVKVITRTASAVKNKFCIRLSLSVFKNKKCHMQPFSAEKRKHTFFIFLWVLKSYFFFFS